MTLQNEQKPSAVMRFIKKWTAHDEFVRDDDPEVISAIEWKKSVQFKPGVNYGWAVKLAKELHEYYEKSADEVDDKAASVVGYLGGGTGLFTLGSVAAVGSGNVHWAIVLAAIPSFIAAGLALNLAAAVRRSHSFSIPTLPVAIDHANQDGFIQSNDDAETGNGEVEFIGQWHEAAAKVESILNRKSELFDRSLKMFVTAVFLLLLPLGTGITVRLINGATKPPIVELIVNQSATHP